MGGAAGDVGLQPEVKAWQSAGKIQQTFGEALDVLRDGAPGDPISTVAAVAGIGFLLGTNTYKNGSRNSSVLALPVKRQMLATDICKAPTARHAIEEVIFTLLF